MFARIRVLILTLTCVSSLLAQPASDPEFFEKRIRPVLATKCYACHSVKTVATAGLALDTREGLRKGGSRGTALIPGDPSGSLLIRAISYDDPALKMPPTGKLSERELADLAAWIEAGAADPRTDTPAVVAETIDIEAGKQWWAFQPLNRAAPPRVRNAAWPRSPIDRYILGPLEAKSLTPAIEASRREWLRRVSFDLIGLPPTREEIAVFLADRSARAHKNVVERLLASPHYGERWARHWLDLVRFGETKGHEFDPEIPEAWRYRDYVIRAFNADLGYDTFVREHLAGDLLENKRLTPDGALYDTPLATGFFGLGEERNAADDVGEVRADKIANQIDVFGKAFFGLTIACARCHDHKFDPIPTRDYYALAGVFGTTQVVQGAIDSPARTAEMEALHRHLVETNTAIDVRLKDVIPIILADWKSYAKRAAECVSAKATECVADGLDGSRLKAWFTSLERAATEPENVLHPIAALAKPEENFLTRAKALRETLANPPLREGDVVFEDFDKPTYEGWTAAGTAFAGGPARSIPPNQALNGYSGTGFANSFRGGSGKLTGVLTSRGFRLNKPYIHIRMGGLKEEAGRREVGRIGISLIAEGRPENFALDGESAFYWRTIRPRRQFGEWVAFEIRDRGSAGYVAVDSIVLSEHKDPPMAAPADPHILALIEGSSSYQHLLDGYVEILRSRAANDPRWTVAVAPGRPLESIDAKSEELARLRRQRTEQESHLMESALGWTGNEDTPRDFPLHIRGNHMNLGPEIPRGFLQVLSGDSYRDGSGRSRLGADMISGRAGDLLARVMVNRIWKHHLGEGLVRGTDNFGKTGDPPTHSELLDWLARRFQDSGWSVKALHREIVLSSVYRTSSQGSHRAASVDPENKLLQHMPIRRLEAESIRDAMLAVSGGLNRATGGPSIAPHISDYQDGRGKPAKSGTLDGEGRRSIYVQVRRNFITPLLLAFDYPLPVQTIGRRGVSTVASQALTMMNNEFVNKQAEAWAARLQTSHPDPNRRIEEMFETAYGRPVTPDERSKVLSFLEEQPKHYGNAPGEQRLWADLAHVVFNSKEFIFVR